MAGEKKQIIALLRELCELVALDEKDQASYRVRAYENAIRALDSHGDEIASMSMNELMSISGVGKSTAGKIREYLETGSIARLEALRKKYPPAFVELDKIPGLGPKTLARLRAQLGIESVADLQAAIAARRVRELPGFGIKSEEKLGRAIEHLGIGSGHERRIPIAEAMPIAEELVAALEALPQVGSASYGGSLRRFRDTIGDIDIVVASAEPELVMEAFVSLPVAAEVIARGDTKSSILTRTGLQVDVRVVPPRSIGAATLYFTGSKAHNVKLRQLAIERGLILNEYSLADTTTGAVVADKTEHDIYRALDLEWIPPPMREDTGEIELAAAYQLPDVPEPGDIAGDLHVHTSLSGDATSPLAEVVARAAARGYSYLAITDHGEDLAINGVSRSALRRQQKDIARLAGEYPRLTLLHGCELNIGPDGSLDYDQDFRLGLDFCLAAVHSHFELDKEAQTRRIIAAMNDPSVSLIGHLSGRLIGRRPGIELDIDRVLEAAAETGTAIEINSALVRLDASAEVLRRGRELGVLFAIDSDAHHVDELCRMQWGIQQATRGWVDKEQVVNTWPRERFLAWVDEKRGR